MNLKELRDIFFDEFGKKIFKYGFIGKIKTQSFDKPFEEGNLSVHLIFKDYRKENQFSVSCDIAIRFDAAEDVFNVLKSLSNKQKRDSYTIGVELGNWAQEGWKSWNVKDVNDVGMVTDEIIAFFEKAGIPYFTMYSNPENAFLAVVNDDRRSQQHSPFHDTRAKKAVALAYVLKKYDLLETLIDKKTAFLKEKDKNGLDPFLEFANYVKGLPRN